MQYFSDEQLDDMFRLLDFDQLEQLGYKMDIYSPDELEDFMITIEEEFSELDREDKIAELQQIGAFDDDYLVDEVKMGAEETCEDSHLDGIDFLPWSEDAEGPTCYITGLPNPAGDIEGEDNICEPCAAKWIYDYEGPEGEGYYRASAMKAETKRERLKREQEEREMDDAATDVDYMREHYAEGDMYPFSGGMVEEYANYLEKICGNHWAAFQEEYYDNMDAEDIPVWNDGIVEWETSGPMSPTGSGYSSASAPPLGVLVGAGDTFLNYTEAQQDMVESSGGLYGAESDDPYDPQRAHTFTYYIYVDGEHEDTGYITVYADNRMEAYNGAYIALGEGAQPDEEFDVLYQSEDSTPVMDPMEFGEMANWKPMDGTPGLKRQRAESDAFIYAYNEGHSDARRDAGYNVRRTDRELTQFKKIFKQAEEFAADSPFNTLLEIREDIIIDDEQDFDRLLSLYMSLESDIATMYQTMDNPKHPLLEEMIRYRNQIATRLDELQEQVEIQEEIQMDAEQRRLADPTVPIQLEKPFRTGYKLGFGAIAAAFTIPLALLGLGAVYNREQQ